MNRLFQALRIPALFIRLPAHRRRLLMEAYGCLTMVRLRLRWRPFERTARVLVLPLNCRGGTRDETTARGGCLHLAREVRWAVLTAARYLPGESVCLPRSVVVSQMLRRRGVSSRLYLGVAHGPDGDMKAHAWIKADGITIMGRGPCGHTVVRFFEPGGKL